MARSLSGSSTTQGSDVLTTKDSYIPVFSGQVQDYREYRKRLKLYMAKMKLLKREAEGILNVVGSMRGTGWKLLESFDVGEAEQPGALDKILKVLDKAFKYDSRVTLPTDFDKYFAGFHRRPGQTMLQYVTEHDELYHRLEEHKVTLPNSVQGWHLLRRAGLTREQRQLVTTQAPGLEKAKVQEALFLIMGQDHRSVAGQGFHRGGRARAFYGGEEPSYHDDWEDEEPYETEDPYTDAGYYGEEFQDYDDLEPNEFDDDAAYYLAGYEDDYGGEDATEEAEIYDTAYAAYVEARKRFNDIKLARGFLPIVALTDGSAAASASSSPTSSPSKGKGSYSGKGKGSLKGKGKGKARGPFRSGKADPRGRAQATLTPPSCLRCGQPGHTTHNCPVPRSPSTSNSPKKRPNTSIESMAVEHAAVTFQDEYGERMDCCMLDPGASAMLSGYSPFLRYITMLQDHGFKIEDLKFIRCDRKFFFGGDANSQCSWTVTLPVCIAGRFGFIQVYLLEGETPLLMGRPIME